MKRIASFGTKSLLGSAGWVVLAAPPIIFASWAYSYLHSMGVSLLAPGRGLQLTYQGKVGPVRLEVESYQLDPSTNRASMTGVRLRDSKGNIFTLGRLTVHRKPTGALDVTARDVKGTVVRRANGSFNLEDFFPDSPPSDGPESAFTATVRHIELFYKDESQPANRALRIASSALSVVGRGDTFSLQGPAALGGVGNTDLVVSVTNGADYRIQADLTRANLTPLIGIASPFLSQSEQKALKTVEVGPTALSGLITVEGQLGKTGRVFGNLTGSLSQVSAPEFGAVTVSRAQLGLEGSRAQVNVDGTWQGQPAQTRGIFSWEKGLAANLTFEAGLVNLGQLPLNLRKELDPRIRAEGLRATGQFSLQNETPRVAGNVTVQRASFGDQSATSLNADFTFAHPKLVVSQVTAQTFGSEFTAGGSVDLRAETVSGFVRTPSANLARLANTFNIPGLTGMGRAEAVFSGKLSAPNITFASRGEMAIRREDIPRPISGSYDLRATGDINRIVVKRGLLTTDEGTLAVTGTVEPKGSLNLAVRASDLRIAAFQPELDGLGFAVGQITGPTSDPRFDGTVETYQLERGEFALPFARADVAYRGGKVMATDIQLRTAISQIIGEAQIDLTNETITAQFSSPGVQLAEVTSSPVSGNVTIESASLSGPLDNPRYRALVSSGTISSGAFSVDRSIALVTGDLRTATVERALVFLKSSPDKQITPADRALFAGAKPTQSIDLPEGAVFLEGTGDLENQSLQARTVFNKLGLDQLIRADERLDVQGTAAGTGTFTIANGVATGGEFFAELEQVNLNGTAAGSGQLSFQGENSLWTGNGGIGLVGDEVRFISIEEAVFDAESRRSSARIVASNLRAESILTAAKPLWEQSGADVQRILGDLRGAFETEISVAYDGDSMELTVPQMKLADLRIGGNPAGEITIRGLRQREGDWSLEAARWQIDDGFAEASGVLDESGNLQASGTGHRIGFEWARFFDATLTPPRGHLDNLDFRLTGTAEAPEAQATFVARGIPTEELPVPPSLFFSSVVLKDGLLTTDGFFEAAEFSGSFDGRGPLSAFSEDSEELFQLSASTTTKELTDVSVLEDWLDLSRTNAQLGASFAASLGRDRFVVRGEARVLGDRITLSDAETEFRNPLITFSTDGKDVELFGQMTSSAGGNLDIYASSNVPNDFTAPLRTMLQQMRLSDRSQLTFEKFYIREGDQGRGTLVSTTLNTDKPFTFRGTLANPKITGSLELSGANIDVPQFAFGQESQGPPIVNPEFDVVIKTDGTGQVRSGPASLGLRGQTTIKGTLEQPVVAGELDLVNGVLNLPSSRIRLDPGGTISVAYRPVGIGESVVEANVNLVGRTGKTIRRPNGNYERYDITVFITGDLLTEGGLNISGVSDPGDLSQSEILAIIGQEDLIRSLSDVARNTQGDALRNTLFQYAIPAVTSGLTEGIASALNFDYLELEFNPFEGPTVAAAISLSRHLTLQGRRRIPVNQFAEEDLYELKLVYRVPSNNAFLSRSRLTLGMDNRSPLRLAIEYSIRF